MIQEKQQIDEIIANSQVAFMNGKYYEAYNQAQEAEKKMRKKRQQER